jgi:LysM repeat protein
MKKIGIVALILVLALTVAGTALAQTDTPTEASWYARYWDNTNMEGDPVLEQSEEIPNHDWGTGGPSPEVGSDMFSARWTTRAQFDAGMYRFVASSDDGVRVWVEGKGYVIDNWSVHPRETRIAYVDLAAGEHDIVVDYFEETGLANISVAWSLLNRPGIERATASVTPQQAAVGETVQLTGQGFPPNTLLNVGFGHVNSEYDVIDTAQTDAFGEVDKTVTVPTYADSADSWVFVLTTQDLAVDAVTGVFNVVSANGGEQPGENTCGDTYVVQAGDNLFDIAEQCGTTIAALVEANPAIFDPSIIYPNMSLTIPNEAALAPVAVIAPDTGDAGTTVTVSIDGFSAFEQVTVGVGPAGGGFTNQHTLTVDAEGNAETAATIPGTAAGPGQMKTWQVVVTGTDGFPQVVSNPFTVTN